MFPCIAGNARPALGGPGPVLFRALRRFASIRRSLIIDTLFAALKVAGGAHGQLRRALGLEVDRLGRLAALRFGHCFPALKLDRSCVTTRGKKILHLGHLFHGPRGTGVHLGVNCTLGQAAFRRTSHTTLRVAISVFQDAAAVSASITGSVFRWD